MFDGPVSALTIAGVGIKKDKVCCMSCLIVFLYQRVVIYQPSVDFRMSGAEDIGDF